MGGWTGYGERAKPPSCRREDLSATDSPSAGVLSQRDQVSLYDDLTEGRTLQLRVEELLERAAVAHPGLVPDRDQIAAERERDLRHQLGVELSQGELLAAWLADPGVGTHLVESMRLPKAASMALLDEYTSEGRLDLGAASVERQGRLGVVTLTRPERLNAENDETTVALETAVDLVLLDPSTEAGVLRGGVVDHPRYRGRRVFSSGLDLSELYAGGISYLFFIVRDLGFVAKMLRGMA